MKTEIIIRSKTVIVEIPNQAQLQVSINPTELMISEVIVQPPYRNQGIGTALVDKVKDFADYLGVERIRARTCNPENLNYYELFLEANKFIKIEPRLWEYNLTK